MGLIIDSFAGGGGASLGLEWALLRSPDAAINHDPEAVVMHAANHPDTKHYCQNIYQVDPRDVIKDCGGGPVDLAWFSPDCKHFSKAKGAAPVKRNIRDLAWVVVHWAELVKPRIIMLENVEEFRTWGPVCHKTNKPIKERAGETFDKWVRSLRRLGYKVQWKELRACDYGAPTIRKRLFLIARCDGKPIVWPEATHGPEGSGLQPYKTAADCIDWSIPCPSIFDRKKDLAKNTNVRLAKGMRKFVIDAPNPYIVSYYGPKKDGDFRGHCLDEPLKTQTTENRHAVVTPFVGRICQNGSSGHRGKAASDPLSTVTSKAEHLLVMPHLSRQFGKSVGQEVNEPPPTTTANGGGKTAIAAAHIVKHFGGVTGTTIDKPAPTTTTRGTQNQIAVTHMTKMRGTNIGHTTDEPIHTLSAGGTHFAQTCAYLNKYYGTGEGADVNEPMHSVTTKDRFGLVELSIDTDPDEVTRYQAWWIARWLEEHDPQPEPILPEPRPSAIEVTIQDIVYVVVDIGMRMLQPRELFLAQGFDADYNITPEYNGKPMTKTAQVRMCGNSVSPYMSCALAAANMNEAPAQIVAAE
ncbi:DNA cytosine methyltransferase [Terasakiella pusilla]|uniref:DNA cytosine methyltransferase n=1 Tax=Terasakiella pusilla TaxID=64973 RepID=UPI003AA8DE12